MDEQVVTKPRNQIVAEQSLQPEKKATWSVKTRVLFFMTTFAVVGCGLGLVWYFGFRRETTSSGSSVAVGAPSPTQIATTQVMVTKPRKGGLGRTVSQPGTVHAFAKADLYANVSGYLIRQKVDIGDIVKKGEVLAEVDAPELFESREQARAALGQTQAKVKQSEARVVTAESDREAVAAQIVQVKADIAKFTALRVYRREQRDRIAELVKRNAVERQLLDEQQEQFDAALSAERSALAAEVTAKANLSAASSRVSQARADVAAAKADVAAAEADLAKAQVFVDFTKISSPYDAVVTHRNFHDGDFIRAANGGGTTAVLSVARTDLMRVVILVPDLDVAFVDRGDPVTIQIEALKGQVFRGKIARFANFENAQKLMRTEVDLPNPDNRLSDGMYGVATLELEPPSKNLTIPSTGLIEQRGQGKGSVYVIQDGKVLRKQVRVGVDNGHEVEILSGLTSESQVVISYSGSIAEGLAVQAVQGAEEIANTAPNK